MHHARIRPGVIADAPGVGEHEAGRGRDRPQDLELERFVR
jgi:hypothetical protein